ncbi:MAG: hypothetical protein RL326_2096 [Pseudomonadota bacterium]|jgi:arginase family enzyme
MSDGHIASRGEFQHDLPLAEDVRSTGMNGWHITIAPHDMGSRFAGSSDGAVVWSTLLKGKEIPFTAFPREHGETLSGSVEAEVYLSRARALRLLLLGCDHSLTFSAVRALVNLHGPLNILVFDAHHDSYAEASLSHYSVFYHITRLLDCAVKFVGCRYEEISKMERPWTPGRPCYVSLDADFFPPPLVRSVKHPVDWDETDPFELFERALRDVRESVIGADIVEWTGSLVPEERELMFRSLRRLMAVS